MHAAGEDRLLDDSWLNSQAADVLTPKATLIAVDVSVRSRRSLQPLLDVWSRSQTPARLRGKSPHWIYFTSDVGRRAKTADQIIQRLVADVESLDRAARRCWNQATSRTFDIGVQAGLEPYSFEDIHLREETIKAVAHVDAQVRITLYAPRREE